MEKARFVIADECTQTDLYLHVKSAASHVESWISSNAGHTLPPTWDNFLHIILPEIKLSHIAEGIEKYLVSTVMSPLEEAEMEQALSLAGASKRGKFFRLDRHTHAHTHTLTHTKTTVTLRACAKG